MEGLAKAGLLLGGVLNAEEKLAWSLKTLGGSIF